MNGNTETVNVAQSKTTANYAVFDSESGDVVGTYIALEAAEQVGEEATLTFGADENLPLSADKTSTNYVIYSDEADAIEAMYVSKDIVANLVEEFDPEGEVADAPELAVSLGELEPEADTSEEDRAEAAAALVGDDSEEEEADPSDEDESAEEESDASDEEVSDEELGIEA